MSRQGRAGRIYGSMNKSTQISQILPSMRGEWRGREIGLKPPWFQNLHRNSLTVDPVDRKEDTLGLSSGNRPCQTSQVGIYNTHLAILLSVHH
jgi:hypothetical protein